MTVALETKKRGRGRPREIGTPTRLNLYVDSPVRADLERLSREVAHERGEPVSIAEALTVAVAESPRLKKGPSRLSGAKRSHGKLSAAIRKGSKVHPQGRRDMAFERTVGDGPILGSTALGAAWVALGLEPRNMTGPFLAEEFPELLSEQTTACPAGKAGCSAGRTLETHIIHLEKHGWTRARVAGWLEKRGL